MKTQYLQLLDRMSYGWNFCSLGGVIRVKISTGDDIAHLNELDKKLWTVLSCPVKDLHFDQKTLWYLDTDKDGKIKVDEVVAASQWLAAVLKNPDLLTDGSEYLPLSNIDTSTDTGISLNESAKKLQKCLGLSEERISVKDTTEFAKAFADTAFNGDGVITSISCEDPLDKKAFDACVATVGHVTDLSGNDAIGTEQVEAFYSALNDWVEWNETPLSDPAILPFGDKTADAYAKLKAVADKINDYFLRCRLIAFDESAQAAVSASMDSITAAANAGNIDEGTAELVSAPLAKPANEAVLSYKGINPAWQEAFDMARKAAFDLEYPSAKSITQQQWEVLKDKFTAFESWMAAKKGAEVEVLGTDAVNELLKDDRKASLLELIEKDKAQAPYLQSLTDLDKLVHLNQYFYSFLRNYVTFTDFYSPEKAVRAVFEEGRLFIDQRCCDLCLRVEDMATHSDMSSLSGMYLIYCTCNRQGCHPFNIVAVLTDGDIKNLRVGINAIFYDRDDNEWDAVVTKIVDNPISLRQAFWAPYRKFVNFIGEKIRKNASEQNDKAVQDLTKVSDNIGTASTGVDGAAAAKSPFDIAKFAGIFAAIGMALGYIGAFIIDVISGVRAAPLWQTLVVLAGIMLLISGPSCLLAGIKLHRRNLGPVLNANGWAINSDVIVNIVFGAALTSVAKYPKIAIDDPYALKKTPWWKKALIALGILLIFLVCLYFTGCFDSIAGNIHE